MLTDGRIFLCQAVEAGNDFIFLALIFGFDRHGQAGTRKINAFQCQNLARRGQGIPRDNTGQFRNGPCTDCP